MKKQAGLQPSLLDKAQLRLKARQRLRRAIVARGGEGQHHHARADADQQQNEHHLQQRKAALSHYFFPIVQLPISSLLSGTPSGPRLKISTCPCWPGLSSW